MIRLAVRCSAEHAELALAQLIELAPTGIEEVRDGDIVEYAIYGPPGEVPTLPDLQVAVGDALVEVRTQEVPDDWHERWRDFHHAVMIGDRVMLRPSWEAVEVPAGVLEIVLDPGQAFGTGSHPTTRLCAELMLDVPVGGEVVDLGCGSGVLAIEAALLGFGPVRCYDFDQLAVDATVANAAANDVQLTAERFDLRDGLPPLAPVVVANLMRPLLLVICAQIEKLTTPHGIEQLILSGLLDEEADELSAAFCRLGLTEHGRVSSGGWTGLYLSTAA
ncbi:MAG: 50S ribosomal protein L11 methyltransferase [Thermoleophilaceae bacterium]|nr:50S ribosomal protein L11 methyltransferase [Thermoleophilaceae bacterium]